VDSIPKINWQVEEMKRQNSTWTLYKIFSDEMLAKRKAEALEVVNENPTRVVQVMHEVLVTYPIEYEGEK